jgi:hypothetical protein
MNYAVLYCLVNQADSAVCLGCSGRPQVKLRHAQECSPSAQVKAAAAHVQTLKQNQQKEKLSLAFVAEASVCISRDQDLLGCLRPAKYLESVSNSVALTGNILMSSLYAEFEDSPRNI